MSRTDNSSKSKRTVIIEEIENDGVRITVAGCPYIVNAGRFRDISTRDINHTWLSDFKPAADEDPGKYAAGYCTDTGTFHGPGGCHGKCHDFNCSDPADFFLHWKSKDGQESCIPVCKWHGRSTSYWVGRTVLWALEYGVADDLRLLKTKDPLPDGSPRCNFMYYTTDAWGDRAKARCTSPAKKRVRITTDRGGLQETYETKLCEKCVANGHVDTEKVEILGEIPPVASHSEE
jgi:hypothetical protein